MEDVWRKDVKMNSGGRKNNGCIIDWGWMSRERIDG